MTEIFVCYFHFTSWAHISLGLHVSFKPMNFEIHLPFGFIRVGMARVSLTSPINWPKKRYTFGLQEQYNEQGYLIRR